MSVTHRARLNAGVTFQITLTVKLVVDSSRPLAVQVEWLGWVAQVRAVKQVLQHLCT